MKKYILLSILVVLILGGGSAWCMKHPRNSWVSNHSVKWMILKEQGIEYENYLYITNNVEEYIQYRSQLLKRYAQMVGEIESEKTIIKHLRS